MRIFLILYLSISCLIAQTISFKPVVSFDTVEGVSYRVESSEDMSSFSTLAIVMGTGESVAYTDLRDVRPGQFYRVQPVTNTITGETLTAAVSSVTVLPGLGESPFDYQNLDQVTIIISSDKISIGGVIYDSEVFQDNNTGQSRVRQYFLTGGNLEEDSQALLSLIEVSGSQAIWNLNYNSTIYSGNFTR